MHPDKFNQQPSNKELSANALRKIQAELYQTFIPTELKNDEVSSVTRDSAGLIVETTSLTPETLQDIFADSQKVVVDAQFRYIETPADSDDSSLQFELVIGLIDETKSSYQRQVFSFVSHGAPDRVEGIVSLYEIASIDEYDGDGEQSMKLIGKRIINSEDVSKIETYLTNVKDEATDGEIDSLLFEEFDDSFSDALELIADCCENPLYQSYAEGRSPLTEQELDEVTPEIQSVIATYGWPTEVDAIAKAPPIWESDDAFMQGLQQGGNIDINMSVVMTTFRAELTTHIQDATGANDIYGTMPHLHRLHAVAPDLVDALRIALNIMSDRYDHHDKTKENINNGERLYDETGKVDRSNDPLLAAYREPHYENIRKAIHMAYKMMARLVKIDDPNRIPGMTNPKPIYITNIERFLRGQC